MVLVPKKFIIVEIIIKGNKFIAINVLSILKWRMQSKIFITKF